MEKEHRKKVQRGAGTSPQGRQDMLGVLNTITVALIKTTELSPSQCWPILVLGIRTDEGRVS